MKKIFFITAILFFGFQVLWAQTPQKMSYQAVVRDASNDLVTNQTVGIKISILQGSATGTPVYVETQTHITNANGLVSMQIGNGTVISGDFTTIDWANGPYFIKTETDPAGGTNYTVTGTSQLLSVPYALYAGKADNVFSGDFNDLSNVPAGLSNGDDINDADHDPSNEIQDISLSGNNLTITNGSTVDLSTISIANTWRINGNTGTNPAVHFIGTTDDNDLVFKRNNINAGIISNFNTAFGMGAFSTNTGSGNTVMGKSALSSNINGSSNTAIGESSIASNTYGYANSVLGYKALFSNTTGEQNIAIGFKALFSNVNGSYNTAVGKNALYSNEGYYNTALGYKALTNNTTAEHNTAVGYETLYSNTTGYANTAMGDFALHSNTTADYNVATGYMSLYNNTTGKKNTAIGFRSLYNNTTGKKNTAIGYMSLYTNSTGYSNTANGYYALKSNVTGYENVAIGESAMYFNTTGYYNTALGYGALAFGNDFHNSTALGFNAVITANNQIRLGNTTVTSIGGFANWTIASDARFKTDIKDNVPGLSFIKKLRPVTYHLDMDAIAKFNHIPDSLRQKDDERQKAAMRQTGFIAQEVELAAQSLGYEFSGVDAPKNNNDYYGLRYSEFVVPLVKAVQEQQKIIEKQQKTIEQQQKDIDELKSLVKKLINKNK